MKSRRILVIALATALLLGLAGGLSQAQGPGGEPLPPNTDLKQQEEAAGRAAQPDATLELTGDLGAGFYYQGTLTQAGVPVSGVRQMEFKLFNAASGGAQVGVTLTQNVTVTKGQFSTLLNWGSAQIQGQALWLHVRAKDSGGVWRDLGRRQILAVPYAMSLIPGASINAQSNTALYLQSAGSDALNVTSTSGDGIHTDGQWDGIHAVNHATYSGNGAVYARAEATTGGATGGNFGTYSEDGFGVAAYNSGTGVASLGFQSGYSPDDPTSYWRPGGLFGGRNGAMGITKEPGGYGLIGWSQVTTGYGEGIEARCDSPDCTAGYFSSAGNGVIISAGAGKTGLAVYGGSKSAVVATDTGSRLLYTEESTEVWFTDYGFGKLTDGEAKIAIDPIFAETVNLAEPYHVFVQAYGDADLYVTNRTPAGFEVRMRSGDAAVEFSYRIVAKRAGFEGQRLERAPWADNDPNLYPEKRGTTDGARQEVLLGSSAP